MTYFYPTVDPDIFDRLSKKYPYIDEPYLKFWIRYEKSITPMPLETRLRLINKYYKYVIPSKPDDTANEPHRLDVLRDEKVLDDVLPTFPTDVCRIILSYGVLSMEEIREKIYLAISEDLPLSRLCLSNPVNHNTYIEFNLIDSRGEVVFFIRFHMNSVEIFTNHGQISTVDFTKECIKNQAIRAYKYHNQSPAFINGEHSDAAAIIVQIVLMWRSWTM